MRRMSTSRPEMSDLRIEGAQDQLRLLQEAETVLHTHSWTEGFFSEQGWPTVAGQKGPSPSGTTL